MISEGEPEEPAPEPKLQHPQWYDQVYARDHGGKTPEKPHGWIQWKGTSVCIDLHCSCGEHGHFDGDFFYGYACVCGKKYAVGQNVRLIELTPDEAEFMEKHHCGFKQADDAE